jgi:hypothetical protein
VARERRRRGKRRVARRLVQGVTVTGVAVTGVLALAGPSSADPNPPGCPPGNFCAYANFNQTGALKLKVAGNWSGTITGVGSVFNNGVPFPGADHVDLTYKFPGGNFRVQCVHYNPGPGHKVNFGEDVVITKVVWRGEC